MASYTDHEKQLLHSISIIEIMAHYGKRLDHTRSGLYYSPFRDERTPSFHIDEAKNTWYDYGTSEGGSLFDFVCKLVNITRGEVYDWLASFRSMVPESEYKAVIAPLLKRQPQTSRIVIDSAYHKFTRRKLIEYAQSRAVSREVLEKYCEEVMYHVDSAPDRQFFAIGFKNNSGGYVLRSSISKRCSSSDITTLGPDGMLTLSASSDKVIVFEGFMDFLSWISHVKQDTPEHDCCILNSVANIGRALPWITSHSSIAAFMDNDKAGRDTLQKIIDNVPETAGDVCVYDMAKLYEGYKDLNEKLSDEMNGSEHSSINIHNHGDNTI
jgi:DNA primase